MKAAKRIISGALFFIVVFACSSGSIAQVNNVPTSADIPLLPPSLDIIVYDIRPNMPWNPNVPGMDFGILAYDGTNRIWRADHYHAVDVNVLGNTAQPWTLTVRGTPVWNRPTPAPQFDDDLDDHLNVRFCRVTGNNEAELLYSVYRACAPNVTYAHTDLTGSFLRVYYGIATGSGDAPGASPPGSDQQSGHYTGTVQIILTTT